MRSVCEFPVYRLPTPDAAGLTFTDGHERTANLGHLQPVEDYSEGRARLEIAAHSNSRHFSKHVQVHGDASQHQADTLHFLGDS